MIEGHPFGAINPVLCGNFQVRRLAYIQFFRIQRCGQGQALRQLLNAELQIAPLNHLLQNVVGEDIGFIEPGDVGVLPPGRLLIVKHHQHAGCVQAPGHPGSKARQEEQYPQNRQPPPLSRQPSQPAPEAQHRQLRLDSKEAIGQRDAQNSQIQHQKRDNRTY